MLATATCYGQWATTNGMAMITYTATVIVAPANCVKYTVHLSKNKSRMKTVGSSDESKSDAQAGIREADELHVTRTHSVISAAQENRDRLFKSLGMKKRT